MATHSSVLAWRIPRMGEPGELPSMGSHRVGHLAAATFDLDRFWNELKARLLPGHTNIFCLEFVLLILI